MKLCTTLNCINKKLAKGLCSKCYYRVKRGGTPELSIKQQMALRKCSISGCNKKNHSNSYCDKHYMNWRRHGDPVFINPKCNRDGNAKKRRAKYYDLWLAENWQDQMAYRQARKKRVRQATPKWADLSAIIEFYKNCPKGHHVDHIIPLHGKIVSGLHIITNLQYLKAESNLKKGNKYGG